MGSGGVTHPSAHRCVSAQLLWFYLGEQGTALVKSLIEEMGAFVTAPTAGQLQHPNTASVKIENHLNINEEGDKMDNYH